MHQAAGWAYAEVGLHSQALAWQTKGLELALAGNRDGDMLWLLAEERAETLVTVGDAPDDLHLRAEELLEREEEAEREGEKEFFRNLGKEGPVAPQRTYVGVAWFPAGQYERASKTWPSFAEEYEHGPYAAYCARLELLLRDLRAQGVARLGPTPIAVEGFLAWCAEQGRDAEQSESRASYATELVERDAVHPWPPRRNDRCWCGSGRKYKKCCLRAA